MRVNCDVCGSEPAAVLCCADEAALCAACDRRVHRANKLAGKHRRIPLISDDQSAGAGPLCDVCKERRGLVFCVEDRAILCAGCDDPIHSANDLTARHTRFLLVGAKLSAAPVDSPDSGGGDSEEDSSADRMSSALQLEASDNSGGAMISDYLTNICPGWRVDDLLFDDSPFSAATGEGALLAKDACARNNNKHKAGRGELEHVPSMDADLFDVVAAGKRRAAWGPSSCWALEEVPTTHWNADNDSDVFAVPEMVTPPPPPPKRPRPSSFCCLS